MKLLLLLCSVLPALARTPSKFIVYGGVSLDGGWPHQLSLRYLGSHSCGATLISEHYAVTGAHCIGGMASLYQIVAGTNRRSCTDGMCEIREIDYTLRHPDFENSGLNGYPNDIAVVGWTTGLALVETALIKYAVMSSTTDWTTGFCFITGWGLVVGGSGSMPEDLYETQIDVITTADCQTLWPATPITDNQICVYDADLQERSACTGDNGGPLSCLNADSLWEFVGVSSWGRSDCSPAYPCFTRASVRTSTGLPGQRLHHSKESLEKL